MSHEYSVNLDNRDKHIAMNMSKITEDIRDICTVQDVELLNMSNEYSVNLDKCDKDSVGSTDHNAPYVNGAFLAQPLLIEISDQMYLPCFLYPAMLTLHPQI